MSAQRSHTKQNILPVKYGNHHSIYGQLNKCETNQVKLNVSIVLMDYNESLDMSFAIVLTSNVNGWNTSFFPICVVKERCGHFRTAALNRTNHITTLLDA